MSKVITNGDHAYGYLDYFGAQVIWTITSLGTKKSQGSVISKSWDLVNFPTHYISATVQTSLSLPATGTGKMKIGWTSVVLEWTTLSNGATLVASGSKLTSS